MGTKISVCQRLQINPFKATQVTDGKKKLINNWLYPKAPSYTIGTGQTA